MNTFSYMPSKTITLDLINNIKKKNVIARLALLKLCEVNNASHMASADQ